MSYDNVTNYTLNRYPAQCNPTCTCQQRNTGYTTMPGLFNFGMSGGFAPANFSFFNFTNSFFPQMFNPFQFQIQLFNNLNFNLSQMFPMPKIDLSQLTESVMASTIPALPSISFGSLTTIARVKSNNKTKTTTTSAYSNRKSSLLQTVEKNDNSFADQLKAKGVTYNAELGHNLAKYTINHSTGGTGRCAHFVNNALEEYNINAKRDDHAYTRANVLANDKNFTEITVKNAEELKSLPGGSVVVYPQGVCNYSNEHGHVFIATGNGGAVSDHIQNNIKYGDGVRVFIPTQQTATA